MFAKGMVLWCVACGTAASLYAMRIMSRTGHDPAALLGVILAFFGGELLLMCRALPQICSAAATAISTQRSSSSRSWAEVLRLSQGIKKAVKSAASRVIPGAWSRQFILWRKENCQLLRAAQFPQGTGGTGRLPAGGYYLF